MSVGDTLPCDSVCDMVEVGDRVPMEAEAVLPRDSDLVDVGDMVMVSVKVEVLEAVAVDRVTLVDAERDCVFEPSLGLAVQVDTVREMDGVEEQVLVWVLVNLGVVDLDHDRVGVKVLDHIIDEVTVGDVETLELPEQL